MDYAVSQTNGPEERNAITTSTNGWTFHLDQRYEILDILQIGQEGVVASARDRATQSVVGIKEYRACFQHTASALHALRDLKLMRLLSHDNIVKVQSIQLPESRASFSKLYVVVEAMDFNLQGVMKHVNELTSQHYSFFLYQLLRALKYLHSAQVTHQALHPQYVLISRECDLKLCHLGLACTNASILASDVSEHLFTRWYSAPELLLNSSSGKASDIWSVGCIFASLIRRQPLFQGTNVQHQLELICDIVGTPQESEHLLVPRVEDRRMLMRIGARPGRPLEEVVSDAEPLALDLLAKMLVFNPAQRISVEDALKHPYLEHLHLEEDEPTIQPFSQFDFAFERQSLNLEELKDLVYEEILLYHFPHKLQEYETAKLAFEQRMEESGSLALPVRNSV